MLRAQSGTPVGSVFVNIYVTTGTPSTDSCIFNPVPVLIAKSSPTTITGLPSTFKNFTWTFPSSPAPGYISPNLPVVVEWYANVTGGVVWNNLSNAGDTSQQCAVDLGGGSWLAACGTCTANTCSDYTLLGVSSLTSTPPFGPSPYGPNPPYYPCCNPVTQNALYGSYIRAPDVDPAPLIWLFVVLFSLTIGFYLIVRATKKGERSRQYEIHI